MMHIKDRNIKTNETINQMNNQYNYVESRYLNDSKTFN